MLDSAAIDRIVQNVLKQISPSPAAAPAKAIAAAAPQAVAGAKTAAPKPAPAIVPAQASTSVAILDRVITGDLLAEKVKGQKVPLVIGAKSLLTPTAHDYIRIHRLEVTRAAAGANGGGGEKSGASVTARWKLAVVRTAPALEKLYADQAPPSSPKSFSRAGEVRTMASFQRAVAAVPLFSPPAPLAPAVARVTSRRWIRM